MRTAWGWSGMLSTSRPGLGEARGLVFCWLCRPPSPNQHPPSTRHPPTHYPTHHHSRISTVEQSVPTNPQRQHSSTDHSGSPAVRQELGGICSCLRLSNFRGRARAMPGRGFSFPSAPGDETLRPLCRRRHRGLMCGAGVARACGR